MPQVVQLVLPPNVQAPEHLAYIELFTPFTAAPHRDHRMYSVKQCFGQVGIVLQSLFPCLVCIVVCIYTPNLDLLHLVTEPAVQSLTDVTISTSVHFPVAMPTL